MSSFVSDQATMANTSTVAEKDAHDKEAQHDVDPRAATSAPLPHSADIHELARKVSRVSHLNHSKSRKGEFEDNPYEDTDNKALDPNSPEFSVKAWVAAILNLHSRDPERYPAKTAGVSFSNLNVYGFGSSTDYQKTVGNATFGLFGALARLVGVGKKLTKIAILRDFEGLLESGEMLIVLGRPGSGCSTLLKTIAGETHGFYLEEGSALQYQGIPADVMHKDFRGEAIYNAETDVHFPQLTVGDTLMFAARARAPRNRLPGVTRKQWAAHSRDVIMAIFGIGHTVNTVVGNDFIRGVSGGERKRVSIAECILSGSPLQCWDNSTRGLDSASALEFVKSLRLGTQTAGSTALVAIYQCSQSAYDIFDKVIVLYAGYQIFFGRADAAKEFFTSRGYLCPPRQTTADFLTSLTNPSERIVAPGWEGRVPRTPEEFAKVWKESPERAQLLLDIKTYEMMNPLGGENFERFTKATKAGKAKRMGAKNPYTISIPMQVGLCMSRGVQRLKGDSANTVITVFGNFGMSLVVGSVFYNLGDTTSTFYSRGALIFFALLMNAFSSALEMLALYAQRPIVEKHHKFAFYHPFAEALSSMLCDMPSKVAVCISFNTTLYFLANLRREPGPFFFFLLISFVSTLVMSSIFRTIAASSRTLQGALAPAAVFILGLVIYTGFALPVTSMHRWSRWINYLDPLAYGFEALLVNEFHNREFPCAAYIPSGPGYANVSGTDTVCSAVGSIQGSATVLGDDYLNLAYEYYNSHRWRNFGILMGFWIGFSIIYLCATEFISAARSKGEVLVFRRGRVPPELKSLDGNDEEKGSSVTQVRQDSTNGPDDTVAIQRQTATLHWEDLCYDIKIKGVDRRILNRVDGWVKPGTLTALMGASGAGKTTLLDVLASRVTMGVISGSILVDGDPRDKSYQRKTGYCMQQDLHLETATVRESLVFAAVCRQPKATPLEEKLAYVEEVIKILEMEEYADAVVGVPGEGLNVEQRKRLTIGVELSAKPDLLLFLDEPSSGLDSQTAWAMVRLCRKLANAGQAILCTIHQPSAVLMAEFDRLLFMSKGGKTVYFGDIGENCSTFIDYFEAHGAGICPHDANPAEWMLEVIGAAPGSHTLIDWHDTWRNSDEFKAVHAELDVMKTTLAGKNATEDKTEAESAEFAMPLSSQLYYCFWRVWAQYWRTPSYIYSKTALCTISAIFIGFSFFKETNTSQGLQNEMFSIFMLTTIFGSLCQQLMPLFVTQRSLYEARERPSKTYAWQAFLIAQILVEIPWQTLMAVITYFCYYYPIGLYENAIPTNAVHERGALMFLLIWTFYIFTSTFAHLTVAALDDAQVAATLANFCFSLTLIFCGVLATPAVFPRFWIFLYRLSPFTYLISAMLTTAVANAALTCSSSELVSFTPASGQTCATYMSEYIATNGGALYGDTASTTACSFCASTETNTYLTELGMSFDDAWRNFGFMWCYIAFNIFGAVFLYWLVRVPKSGGAHTIQGKKE